MSTYSEIHRTNSNGIHKSKEKYQRNNIKNDLDGERVDVASVQYLSSANPSRNEGKSGHSEPGQRARGKPTYYSSSEAIEYLPGSESDPVRVWFGSCKRFQGVERGLKAAPYHTDPIGI